MKKVITTLLLIATTAMANDQCVMQERVVTQTDTKILERSKIRRDVVPSQHGRKCIVDFRVRVGREWHTAFGEHTWPGDRPSEEACAVAVKRAEDDVQQRLGRTVAINERILVCKDRPELETLRRTQVGTIGDAGQFRIHPNYPEKFYHNGAQCRWFVEPAFTGRDIRTFQGVICNVQDQKWVVVDKF
jgi:hypothetical protein